MLAHGGVLAWLEDPSDPPDLHPPSGSMQLQVVLTRSKPEDPPSTSPAAAPAPLWPFPSTDRETSTDNRSPQVAEVPLVARPEARTPLDLERPARWDDLLGDTTGSASSRGGTTNLAFTPALAAALVNRDSARRREALVAERAAAVHGVADASYTREGPRGSELKLDGRCITLVEDHAVESGVRWWSGTCTETRTNPILLNAVEYDRLGRLLVD